MRHKFYMVMWLLYMAIVGLSILVATVRHAIGDDGSLHHFISMTSNHLVLVRPMVHVSVVPGSSEDDGHRNNMPDLNIDRAVLSVGWVSEWEVYVCKTNSGRLPLGQSTACGSKCESVTQSGLPSDKCRCQASLAHAGPHICFFDQLVLREALHQMVSCAPDHRAPLLGIPISM